MTEDTTIEIPIEPNDATVYYIQATAQEMGHALSYEEAYAMYRMLVEHEMMEE